MIKSPSFLFIVALIFLIRSMMPAGFMPDFSGHQTIQICSGTEIKTISIDDEETSPHPQKDQSPCSYSFLSTSFSPSEPYSFSFQIPILKPVDRSFVIQVLDTHRFHLSPPSRAPPSLTA
ncbi:MAG: hypothetical protein JNL76_08470 [Alphaproteobacteria bacterium]|nr:hypothetical protein [Alphaproteobacteria bacterium]